MKKRGLIICMVILSILCSKTALKAAAARSEERSCRERV